MQVFMQKGRCIHFDTPLSISEESWPIALQTLLPEDIAVLKVEKVTADLSMLGLIQLEKNIDIISEEHSLTTRLHVIINITIVISLDLDKMREAVSIFIGYT